MSKLQNPKAVMTFTPGREEDNFLKSLNIFIKDIEFRADNCTKVSLDRQIKHCGHHMIYISLYLKIFVVKLRSELAPEVYIIFRT